MEPYGSKPVLPGMVRSGFLSFVLVNQVLPGNTDPIRAFLLTAYNVPGRMMRKGADIFLLQQLSL